MKGDCSGGLSWCDACSVTYKPRYRLRPKSVALTRLEWWIIGIALLVAVLALVLRFNGDRGLLGLFEFPALFTVSVILIRASGRDASR